MPRRSDVARWWPPWWRGASGLAKVFAAVGSRAGARRSSRRRPRDGACRTSRRRPSTGACRSLRRQPRADNGAQELPGRGCGRVRRLLEHNFVHPLLERHGERVQAAAPPPAGPEARSVLGPAALLCGRERGPRPSASQRPAAFPLSLSLSLSSLSPAGGCARPLSPALRARGASARRCEEPAGMASASHLVAGLTTTIFLDGVARRGVLFCCKNRI